MRFKMIYFFCKIKPGGKLSEKEEFEEILLKAPFTPDIRPSE
jgi:hypothetical protein